MLADTLWQRHCPTAELREGADSPDTPEATSAAGPGVNEELAWLKTATLETPADVNQVLAEVVKLIRPLTAQHTVRLEVVAFDLPGLAVHPVALSQLLLNLLTVAIHRASGGDVTISARPLPFEVEILIHGHAPASALKPTSNDDTASIDLARQLADLCGTQMTLVGRPGCVPGTNAASSARTDACPGHRRQRRHTGACCDGMRWIVAMH